MNMGWFSWKTIKVLLCFSLELNLAFKFFLIIVILFWYYKNNSCSNYYRIHGRWMNSYKSCWRNHIHNTDAKCRKTKRIPHKCGTTFGHIGETRMENSIMMDFEVVWFSIIWHLQLSSEKWSDWNTVHRP